MSDTPNSPPPAPKSNMGLIVGAVALAGIAAAGVMLFNKKDAPSGTASTPAPAQQASAPVAPTPPPPPPAPKTYSDTIGDLDISTSLGTVSVKGLKTVKASLTKEEVTAAYKGDAALLAKLDAEAVTADSISWNQTFGEATTHTSYETVEARGIKGGVISTLSVAKGSSTGGAGEKQRTSTTMEGLSLLNFDAPLMLRWFNEADPEGKAEFKPLHGAYTVKSTKVTTEAVTVDVGPMTLSDSKVRPARRAVSAIMADIRAQSELAKKEAAKADGKSDGKSDAPAAPGEAAKVAKPDEVALLVSIADLASSFEFGRGGVDGVKIAAIDPKNNGPSAGEIRKIEFAGGSKGYFSVLDSSVTGNDGKFTLGKLESRGDIFALILAGADKAIRSRAGEPKPGDEELRKSIRARLAGGIPDVSFAVEGMAGDFPNEKGKPEAGRMAFSLGRFMLNSGNFVAFTPTRIDYVIEKLDVPLPKDSREAGVIALREMGLERMSLGARIAASWTEAAQGLSIKEVSVDMAQLARLAISGEIGNVPRAFFEDPQTNWPSAMGATINGLVIDIENKGGLAKLVDVAAREQKKTGEQLRKEFANIAPLVIAGMLAGHPDSGKVAQAVADFIRNLNSLHLKVTAAGPNGIVLTDLATAGSNPAEFAQKLRFEMEGK